MTDAALAVLFRDEQLAVVNKPAGLMVHDSALARGETDFAADRLREQFGRPIFLVHRLDLDALHDGPANAVTSAALGVV